MDQTCDGCGAALPGSGPHFVLRLALDAVPRDPDGDPVRATAELLDELESGELGAPHRAEYELCKACRARVVADPLGRAAGRAVRFSWN